MNSTRCQNAGVTDLINMYYGSIAKVYSFAYFIMLGKNVAIPGQIITITVSTNSISKNGTIPLNIVYMGTVLAIP
jgi:hypothetical protein